ncbi:hypothetical protein [Pseudomonas indica]|uniref:hypothetical protein n=1 Tax=Pseudomonas indica TaxID=137658 RepID=UPI0023F85D1A|nr:hypothetical protein [Pseudomonas indica]MBU3056553.1 hypothetical protein [Pseudomonas indica]
MSDFETDVMEDLLDAAEGPARQAYDALDEFDGGDEFDEYDEYDDFLGGVVGRGQAADDLDEFSDGYAEFDSLEDAVADALEADDADEFLSRLRNFAQRVRQGIGRVARVVAPIARAIPLPQAQLVGRIAGMAGRLLADGADEFEAIDELVDSYDDDAIDAAAPIVAGLAVRRAVPNVARLPQQQRRQLVRSATQATRTLVRRQGAPAARAVPRIVTTAQRAVQQRRVPPRAIPQVVRRVTQQVVRRPNQVRQLSRPLTRTTTRVTGRAAGSACPHCGHRHMRIRGPVTIHIGR